MSGAFLKKKKNHLVHCTDVCFLLPSFVQRDDVPAQHRGSVSAGEEIGTAPVLEIVTEIAGGVVLDLLTGGVRGEETLFKHGRLVLATICFLGKLLSGM